MLFSFQYVSKCPDSSKDFKKIARSVISKKNETATAKSVVNSIMMETTKTDTPKEEACLQLLKSRDYMNFSKPMRPISLTHACAIRLDKDGKDLAVSSEKSWADAYFKRDEDEKFLRLCEEYEKDPEEYFRKLRKFQPNWRTPKKPSEIKLIDYAAFFNKNWTMTTSEHFPVFSPAFKNPPHKSHTERFEQFARTRMLMYTPGAKPETIFNGFDNVEAAMEYFVLESGYCPNSVREEWVEATKEKPSDMAHFGDEEASPVEEDEEFAYPDLAPSVEG